MSRFNPFSNRYQAALDQALSVRNQGNGVSEYIPSSDARVSELLMGGVPAAAGIVVTPDSAMRVAAVYACVTRIAGGISTLPCNIYERTWDSSRGEYVVDQVEDAPLWWLLNEAPTAAWTGSSHWEAVTGNRTLRGDHFTEIRRNSKSGTLNELVPMPWGAVLPARQTLDVASRLMYAVNDGLRSRGVDQDDMLHIPGFGFDGLRGRSVISHAARNAAGNAMAMDEYAGKFFANGAHPSIAIQGTKVMSAEQIAALQETFRRKYSGLPNAHALPLVLTEGFQVAPISISAEDSQLLDARKFQVIDIARAFGVPPHMIGETSGSTSWGTGIESMGRMFVMLTLAPHLTAIEQELNKKLYRTSRRFIAFDRDALMQGDMAAQGVFNRAALGGPGAGPGWMSVNDVRRRQKLAPMKGHDEIYMPPVQATAPKLPLEEKP